jgi:hypothetical protein
MPKSHQAHLEWTPSRLLIHWAATVGTATGEVVRTILESKPHPEMGYRACLGIMRLAKTYSSLRLEAASQRAIQRQACSYQSLRSMLRRSLDQQTTTIDKPLKGTAFKLSATEALLVSSPPPFKGSTPRPLHIRTDGDFPVEKAIHSVLSLTLLHYGSVREPRLPVTIHYSDKIAELSLLGIKPKDLEGDMPFWL